MKEIMIGITALLIWGIAILIAVIPKIIFIGIDVIKKLKNNK